MGDVLKSNARPHADHQGVAVPRTAAGVDDVLQIRLDAQPRPEVHLISNLEDILVIRQRQVGAVETVGFRGQTARVLRKTGVSKTDTEKILVAAGEGAAVVQAYLRVKNPSGYGLPDRRRAHRTIAVPARREEGGHRPRSGANLPRCQSARQPRPIRPRCRLLGLRGR